MDNIKVSINDTALKVIGIVAICSTILVASTLFINARAEDRKAEVIRDCFNVATYNARNDEAKSEVSEPILRFFKSCMQFNGYGSNYTFLNE
jgi:hypothetical protein